MNVKKILDLIFEPVDDEEEQAEVIVDTPLERDEFKKVVKKAPEVKVSNTEVIAKRAEVKKKDVLDRGYSKKYDINLEKRTKKENKPLPKYEPQPPMSPIFGVLEKAPEGDDDRPHFVPSNNTKTHKSSLGTVLSPIYGVIGGEDVKENKVIITKDDDSKTKVVSQSNIKPLADDFDTIEMIKVKPEVKAEEKKEEVTPISVILERPSEVQDETYISSEDITLFDDLEKK